jgi:translocation and assembly module TamB
VTLHSLRITAERRGGPSHSLEVTGDLEDFTHPHWHAHVQGDLDMRLLDPITGYADAPEGVARLDLSAAGQEGAFQIDGGVHIDDGSYIGEGVHATGITGDAHIRADGKQLLVTGIDARLRQGGQLEGTVALEPWLPSDASAHRQQTPHATEMFSSDRNTLVRTPPWIIPVNGKVTAEFKDVALDTVLDMVSPAPYRRMGLDARLNGPVVAVWTHGDGRTVSVDAQFGLSPSRQTPAGEVPTTGAIDATYAQHNGAVEVRKLDLHLPQSEIEAHGVLGAYPTASPSALTIDFHSHNLAEFDTALRSLGFKRNGKTGAAALPVLLAGQADFHGSWTGSLARPHIAGTVDATQIALELPAGSSGTPQFLRFDTVSASGLYSPSQIVLQHAQLQRGTTRIALNGTVDAYPGASLGASPGAAPGREPVFDANAVLHAHFDAANLELADVQPLITAAGGPNLPLTGAFNARITADGPLHTLTASGSAQMERGSLYGEPVSGLRVEAALAGQVLKLTTVTFNVAGGNLSASGSYDFNAERSQPGHFQPGHFQPGHFQPGLFQIDARAQNIDIARVDFVRSRNFDATGKLAFSISGSGTLKDPRLEGHATVTALTFGGQLFGTLEATAHSAGPLLEYSATTQLEQAGLTLHGQTTLQGDYPTHAQLEFSRFNLGTLLRMAHIAEFNGESALAGTVSVDGPLAHPRQLRGEAQLRELAFTISGVQLQGDGGLHATLAEGRIHLDPLHVTGENTDLHVQGDLSLEGAQQLDLASSGSIDLKLAETLDSDLTASGLTTFQVQAHGPLLHPDLEGRIDFQNGALSLEDLPNGLSQLHGTLEFNQNRLEVRNLTAMSGGGLLTVGGYLAYQHGIYADLSVTGKQVHIRYPEGVSSLADATFHLQGAQNNLFLSGDVLITRFSVSPDLDLAALAVEANASVQTVAPPDAPSNHVRLDVHIVSSPQLSFQNAFAKLAGDVDLSLRGTLASPSLLGRVSVTEGSALIAGTRYDLERGDITFTNPVRIEPIIDLSATAHVEDYDISLGLHGSPQKLSVSYRSDPPLPEADVVSLLALGHTASQQRLYTQQQEQAITNSTDALLGGALNATVSSRVQKLFGAGSVKVDPNYLGAFGNSTSRITVQEQFGRSVILTYATDVNTTSQQLLQAEVAINRHVSVVVARDESGVFSMVIKATRRFR